MKRKIFVAFIVMLIYSSVVKAEQTRFNLYPLYQQMNGKLVVETVGPITFSISPGYGPMERVKEIKISLNEKVISYFLSPPYVCSFSIDSGGVNQLRAIILYEDVNTKKIRKEICIGEVILKGAGDRSIQTIQPFIPSQSFQIQPKKQKNKKLVTRLALIIGGGVLFYIGHQKEKAIDEAKSTIPDYYGDDWWDRRDFVGDKTSAYLLQGLGGGLILYGIFGDF